MIQEPILFPLAAHRFTAFRFRFDVRGEDLTGHIYAMQVRDAPNGGTLRFQLNQVGGAGTQGLVPSSSVVSGETVHHLEVRVDRTTIEPMPLNPVDPDQDATFHYDILAEPPSGPAFVFAQGTFTVRPGVTEVVL